jgi:hypothetical protein
MGMSTTDCSEGILNPWATTDASRQCDTVQSVGSGDLLTSYLAVAFVLLLYNIGILAYLASRGLEKGVQDRKIRLASTIGGIATVASYFAVKFLPPLNASLSNNVIYGIISGLAMYIGLSNVVVAFGFLAESGPGPFKRSRKGTEYDHYKTSLSEDPRSSTDNRSVRNGIFNTTDTPSQIAWYALNQCESLIESDSSNISSDLGSINSINKRSTSTSIVDKKVTRYADLNQTNIAAQSIQKNLGPHAYPQTYNDAITKPSIANNFAGTGRRCKQFVDRNGQQKAENIKFISIVKLLKDPVLSMKIVRRAVKMLNQGIVIDHVLYQDRLQYLKIQDAILIWILGDRPIKFVKHAPLYHKLATKRTLQRLKSLRLIENTSGFPRLSERGRMVREALRLAAESLREDPRAGRGASPVTVK